MSKKIEFISIDQIRDYVIPRSGDDKPYSKRDVRQKAHSNIQGIIRHAETLALRKIVDDLRMLSASDNTQKGKIYSFIAERIDHSE